MSRAPSDGGLRPLFFKRLRREAQLTAIETGQIVQGVPDCEFVFKGGCQGWIEFKAADGWRPVLRPLQVSWIARRARLGGNVWIAVRRAREELWLVPGGSVEALHRGGLRAVHSSAFRWTGGIAGWDWAAIRRALAEGSQKHG
jgi:hypothetical protein